MMAYIVYYRKITYKVTFPNHEKIERAHLPYWVDHLAKPVDQETLDALLVSESEAENGGSVSGLIYRDGDFRAAIGTSDFLYHYDHGRLDLSLL